MDTTQIYISVSGAHLEAAINTLDPGHEKIEADIHSEKKTACKQSTSELAEEQFQSDVAAHKTPHKQKMSELAKTLAERINVPSLWDKGLWRDLPIDFKPGKYYLPIGEVEIDEGEKIKVNYYNVSSDFAELHLIKGLFSHLSTSGLLRFSKLVGDKGKLDELTAKIGQHSQGLLEFLKLIKEDVGSYRAKMNLKDEIIPGLTGWFIFTIWKDSIDKANGHPWIHDSWYKSENIPDTNLLRLNCGGNTLGIAISKKTLKTYERRHNELRANYAEHPSAKDINEKNQELCGLSQEIRQRLLEFSDMEHLPGRCELC
jgi:hypothetical protein